MPRIKVLDINQPIKHISKSAAHRLELTGYYRRTGNTLTRILHRIQPTSFAVGRSTEHAPDRLPPIDLPGLRFIPPKPL